MKIILGGSNHFVKVCFFTCLPLHLKSTTFIPTNFIITIDQGPWDIGFQTSYITLSGIQKEPYVFLRDGYMPANFFQDTKTTDDITYWEKGSYTMPQGTSTIIRGGEGSFDWDSTAYNMILVNETETFLDDHLDQYGHGDDNTTPFFTYVALGSVHEPHSPPTKYMDDTLIDGQHPTKHLDMLSELDKVVGSLVSLLESRDLIQDTIILFTSDNGGLGGKFGSENAGHKSNGILRSAKGDIYEGGHRVPFTLRWDNGHIPKGQERSSHFVGLNDVYATICDFVNITLPRDDDTKYYYGYDSQSFASYVWDEKETEQLRKTLGMWKYFASGNGFLKSHAIREGNMKLIVHEYIKSDDKLELYDLSTDISEQNNIIDSANETYKLHLLNQLKEIGPCHDVSGKFLVKNKIRSCNWFKKKNTLKRCARLAGWAHCGQTCENNCAQSREP